MADETTTPVAETEPAPAEHTAAPADPNAVENALEVLAEQPAPAVEQPPATPGDKDGDLEPLGTIIGCP